MPVAVDTAHKKVVVAAVDTVASSSSSFVVAVAVVKGVPVARLPVQVAAVVAVVSFALPLRMERFDRTGSVSSLSLFSIPSELFCPPLPFFGLMLLQVVTKFGTSTSDPMGRRRRRLNSRRSRTVPETAPSSSFSVVVVER